MMKQTILIALAALLAAAACSASAKFRADSVPGFGQTTIEVGVDARQGTVSVPEGGPLKKGDCVDVTFFDADGKALGSAKTTAGGKSVKAPKGTDSVGVSPCDPVEAKPDGKTESWVGGESRLPGLTFAYQVAPMVLGRSVRVAQFTVTAESREAADDAARSFMAAGPSAPPPLGVSVGVLARAIFRPDGSVRFTLYSVEAPTMLDFSWNGRRAFLWNAVVRPGRGFYAVSLVIPSSEVAVPSLFSPATNRAEFDLGTRSGSSRGAVDLSVSL